MRAKYLLGLGILLFFFSACKKSDIEYNSGFAKSKKALSSFKATTANSYRFQTQGGSWTGFSWQTTIKVVTGVAVERTFRYTAFSGVRMPEAGWTEQKRQEILTNMQLTEQGFVDRFGKPLQEVLDWFEVGATLGTTQNTPANQLFTLDEVYEKAKNDWLLKKPDVTTYFETKNNGMISTCGYVPDGCADDCFRGIEITFIESL